MQHELFTCKQLAAKFPIGSAPLEWWRASLQGWVKGKQLIQYKHWMYISIPGCHKPVRGYVLKRVVRLCYQEATKEDCKPMFSVLWTQYQAEITQILTEKTDNTEAEREKETNGV